VLDVACGAGYGADILIQNGALLVVGIEKSESALEEALSRRGDAFFLCRADATRLPVPTGAFDAVTSFETVEHLDDDRQFVSELRRVLDDDGIAIVSTPNALHTRPVDGVPSNPFHVREYEPEEFRALLSERFSAVELLTQVVSAAYGFCPYWRTPGEMRSSWRNSLSILSWKLFARLPERARDSMERIVRHRTFYPSEADFSFDRVPRYDGHVLVAICTP
jgi:SAM-dependent methyltransferase